MKKSSKENKTIKAWAVINKRWEAYGWNDPFYEQLAAIRGEGIFTCTIFKQKKEAEVFKKVGGRRCDKIITVEIKILDK